MGQDGDEVDGVGFDLVCLSTAVDFRGDVADGVGFAIVMDVVKSEGMAGPVGQELLEPEGLNSCGSAKQMLVARVSCAPMRRAWPISSTPRSAQTPSADRIVGLPYGGAGGSG